MSDHPFTEPPRAGYHPPGWGERNLLNYLRGRKPAPPPPREAAGDQGQVYRALSQEDLKRAGRDLARAKAVADLMRGWAEETAGQLPGLRVETFIEAMDLILQTLDDLEAVVEGRSDL